MAVVIGVVVVVAGLALVLVVLSPGRMRPLVDAKGRPIPGSLSEKVFLEIGGVRQGMFIQSRNPANPVLLVLHGGMPETFLTDSHPTGLEELFTVVWWEQRGSGISYSRAVTRESLNLDQLVADTLSVTDYLRERFHKDKVFLMGHSGGSFVGIHAAARAPERFAAYIGLAQMSDQLSSEIEAYQYMLERYRELGRTDRLARLEAVPVTREGGVPGAYQMIRDVDMHELGIGTTRDMRSLVTGLLLPSLAFPGYTFAEKLHLWTGKAKSGIGALFPVCITTDLGSSLTEFALPIYFLHGVHDRTCSYSLARQYYGKVTAPVKGFYTFEASAHSPTFEEPERVLSIMRAAVLTGSAAGAD